MQNLSLSLKIRLALLALVFPVSLAFLGLIMGWYFHKSSLLYVFSSIGFVIGVLLNIACYYRKLFTILIYKAPIPSALFLLLWWIASSFFSEAIAFSIGVFGLLIGLFINYVLVHPYQFYRIPKRILALVYLFFSIASMGFFLGLPIMNLLLGILAGNYLSIRVLSNKREQKSIKRLLIFGSLFSAAVMLGMVFISAFIFKLDLENGIAIINDTLKVNLKAHNFMSYFYVIGILLSVLQFYITLFTAKTMLSLRRLQKRMA